LSLSEREDFEELLKIYSDFPNFLNFSNGQTIGQYCARVHVSRGWLRVLQLNEYNTCQSSLKAAAPAAHYTITSLN